MQTGSNTLPRIRHSLALWACSQYEDRNKYETNRIVRYTHTWTILKHFAGTSGLIQEWNSQIKTMCSLVGCSRNTLITHIRQLKEMDWLYFDQHCIKMHSERKVYEACGINHFKKFDRIFYLPEKNNDEKRTHYWIYLAEISDNRQRQAYVLHQKIINNPEMKLWLYGLLSSRGHNITTSEKDPLFVASLLFTIYIESFHSKESEMYDWLVENRPDVNRGVNGMATAWNTKPMNVSYVKKKIVEQKIGFVQKIGTITSPGRSRNKYVHLTVADGKERARGVGYNRVTKSTFQAFCDDILPRMAATNADQHVKMKDAA